MRSASPRKYSSWRSPTEATCRLAHTLFWDCKFDDLAGDGLEGKATELIRRAEHDELDLAARIRAAMKLREKREQRLAQASGSVAASAGKVPWSGPSDRLP